MIQGFGALSKLHPFIGRQNQIGHRNYLVKIKQVARSQYFHSKHIHSIKQAAFKINRIGSSMFVCVCFGMCVYATKL
jgi:hypothetical protein